MVRFISSYVDRAERNRPRLETPSASLERALRARRFVLQSLTLAAVLVGSNASFADEPPTAVRTDLYGDPLPKGAISRFGTIRFRHEANRPECVSFSPDSKMIVSVSGYPDKTVRAWEVSTGKPLWKLEREIFCVAFSPDGKTLACGGLRKGSLFVEALTGRVLRAIACDGEVRGIAFSPDGTRLAMATRHDGLQVVNTKALEDETNTPVVKVATKSLEQVVFSPNGQWIACGGEGKFWLCEAKSGKLLHHWTAAEHRVSGLAFHTDGERLAAVSGGKALQWKVPIVGDEQVIESDNAMGLSANGKKIVSMYGSGKFEWLIHDLEQGSQIRLVPPPGFGRVVFAGDGKLLATLGSRVQIYSAESGKSLHDFPVDVQMDEFSEFSPDGKFFASRFKLWDSATGKGIYEIDRYGRLVFAPDGSPVEVTYKNDRLQARTVGEPGLRFDEVTYHPYICPRTGHVVLQLPDKKVSATEPPVQLWNLWTARPEHRIDIPGATAVMHGSGYDRLALSDDARQLAVLAPRDRLELRRIESGERLRCPVPVSASGLFFSPCGRIVAAYGMGSGTFQLTQTADLADVATIPNAIRLRNGEQGTVGMGLLVDPLEIVMMRRLEDSVDLKSWDAITGELVESRSLTTLQQYRNALFRLASRGLRGGPPRGFTDLVSSGDQTVALQCRLISPWFSAVALSPSGQLAAFAQGRSVTVWEAASGQPVNRMEADAGVNRVIFSPDDRVLFAECARHGGLVLEAVPVPNNLHHRGVQALLDDLAQDDVIAARCAVMELAKRGDEILSRLPDSLPKKCDPAEIRQWIADLDADEFAGREAAQRKLIALGVVAWPALRAALGDSPSEEQAERIKAILARDAPPRQGSLVLRGLRAIHVAELNGSSSAIELLKRIAAGPYDSQFTSRAATAAQRLSARPANPPR